MKAFVKVLEDPALYESGARTAGKLAKEKKHNLQAVADQPEVTRIVAQVREDLSKNAQFRTWAVPARMGRVMVSRYESGMTYGTHFDDAFIEGVRTDLSFTLFLSDMDTYEGGDLSIYDPPDHRAAPRERGTAVAFPAYVPHAVLPVTRGTRCSLTAWVLGPPFR